MFAVALLFAISILLCIFVAFLALAQKKKKKPKKD
jgi:hypothetical protein